MRFELGDCGFGVGVVAVADRVAVVGPGDGVQNLGMDAGVIVAGEAANGLRWHF